MDGTQGPTPESTFQIMTSVVVRRINKLWGGGGAAAEGALCEKFSNFSKSLLFRLCMRAKEREKIAVKKIFGKRVELG